VRNNPECINFPLFFLGGSQSASQQVSSAISSQILHRRGFNQPLLISPHIFSFHVPPHTPWFFPSETFYHRRLLEVYMGGGGGGSCRVTSQKGVMAGDRQGRQLGGDRDGWLGLDFGSRNLVFPYFNRLSLEKSSFPTYILTINRPTTATPTSWHDH
jgi:hypothetical protein